MRRHALPFLIGALSGALGGLMGVGGGIILVPLLVYALHVAQHEAQGTSLAFVIVSALVAAGFYLGYERLDLPLALWLSVGAIPGVLLGSRLAANTPAARLRAAFGVVMLLTAIRMLVAPPLGYGGAGHWPVPLNLLLGLVVGTLAGFLGVGGGTFLVPVLVLGQKLDQHTAQGVSLVMIVPVGIVGVVSYSRRGRMSVAGLPMLIAGGAVGALAGALVAHRINSPTLSRLFAVFMLAMGGQMIFVRPRGTVARSAENPGGTP
jgi:uncharacterized membrane protein YfcA